MSEIAIAPLRKKTLNGDLYVRDARIEELLAELSSLPRNPLVERVKISNKADPKYVPSECLVYFVRATRSDNREDWFERLYRILLERVLRSLPRPDSRDGKSTSLAREAVREKVLGRFAELLSADREEYIEKLDYFEVRFDGALANLRRDAQEKVWRDENRSKPLEYDEESGELSAEVEEAAGVYDPFDKSDLDDPTYRSRLEAAINALPPEQSRIIHMLREGFPIDSKEPGVMTIATALGRSEKTIRTYRDKAYAALRAAMCDGGDR